MALMLVLKVEAECTDERREELETGGGRVHTLPLTDPCTLSIKYCLNLSTSSRGYTLTSVPEGGEFFTHTDSQRVYKLYSHTTSLIQ